MWCSYIKRVNNYKCTKIIYIKYINILYNMYTRKYMLDDHIKIIDENFADSINYFEIILTKDY